MGCLWKLLIFLVLLSSTAAKAHVGSPDVFFEGAAGPYRLFVTVRLPVVIPGVAEIEIRSESSDLREVHIVPLRLTGPGSNLPPTPDVARRSQADPQFFTGSLGLMEGGSLQVRILADGARGKGTVSVPVPSVAQRVLSMQKPLGALLFGVMLLLAAGAVSIAFAAGRDSGLSAGQRPTPADSRRGRLAGAVAAGIVLCMVYLGGRWWRSEASFYEDNVYKPPRVNASVQPGDRL